MFYAVSRWGYITLIHLRLREWETVKIFFSCDIGKGADRRPDLYRWFLNRRILKHRNKSYSFQGMKRVESQRVTLGGALFYLELRVSVKFGRMSHNLDSRGTGKSWENFSAKKKLSIRWQNPTESNNNEMLWNVESFSLQPHFLFYYVTLKDL